MDLQSFIKEALVQIAKGIEDAGEALQDSDAIVNPSNVVGTGGDRGTKVYGWLTDNRPESVRRAVQNIEFDVAVTAASGTETKGGIGIMVGMVVVGSQGKSDASQTSQSRIQFSVPMALPTTQKF